MRNRYRTLPSTTDPHSIVVADTVEGTVEDVAILGHNYYCRKALRPEMLGGIVLFDAYRENNNFAEVMAVGTSCGSADSRSQDSRTWNTIKGKTDMCCGVGAVYEPGDLLAVPDQHEWGINRGLFGFHEYYIDERVPMAVIKKGETEMRPTLDKVLIETIADTKLDGGLVLADIAQEEPEMGVVISTGPGRLDRNGELIPLNCKVGDKVVIPKWYGTDMQYEGKTLKVLPDTEVLGIVS